MLRLSIIRPILLAFALIGAAISTKAAPADELVLLMVEEHGCFYCAKWNEEISPEYPITPEGLAAPLQRIEIQDQPFEGLEIERRVIFTPTFILLKDNKEVGRLEGYIGEDFFWGLLQNLIASAGHTNAY